MKKRNFEFASNNSGTSNIERYEISKFELANKKDYIDVTYILASSVANLNGFLMEKEELEKAKETIIHQPLIYVPNWENLPTGHSLANFPALDWDAKIVGTHVSSEIVEENDVTHLKTTSRVWKIRHPELAQTMINLHAAGELKFSMECAYESAEVEGSTRKAKGINFVGSCVVDDPANQFSYSLQVASNNKQQNQGGNSMFKTLEEAIAHIGGLDNQIKTIESAKATAEKQVETLTTEKSAVEEALKTANTTIDTLKSEVAAFEQEKKEAAERKLGTDRLAEMAKYVEYKDEEKEAKMTAFASMSEDVFKLILETAQRNKPAETNTEVAGVSSDTKIDLKANEGNFLAGL